MWMHHDSAWWLGIIALVLMIPANLLANFLTPVLKNWWATRSIKITSLKKRIEKLETSLSKIETIPVLTPFQHSVLRGIAQIGWLISSVGNLVIGLVIILSVWYELAGNRIPDFVFGLLFSFTIAKMIVLQLTVARLASAAAMGTEKGREELRASIDKLKAKLPVKSEHAFQ
jgi:hypothetical protein